MGQVAAIQPGAVCPDDDEIDLLVERVEEALGRITDQEVLRFAPSAPEAVLALCGCSLELRPGPWRAVCSALRSAMLAEEGVSCGTC